MLDLKEGCRPLIWGNSSSSSASTWRAGWTRFNNASHHLIMQQEIIGAGRELNQLIGHSDVLSDASRRSIQS